MFYFHFFFYANNIIRLILVLYEKSVKGVWKNIFRDIRDKKLKIIQYKLVVYYENISMLSMV